MSIYEIPELLRHRATVLGDWGEKWLANLNAMLGEIEREWGLDIEAQLSGGTEVLVASRDQPPNANFNPGVAHSVATSLPVPESVMKAVRRSAPPKQMFVVSGSGIATCSRVMLQVITAGWRK